MKHPYPKADYAATGRVGPCAFAITFDEPGQPMEPRTAVVVAATAADACTLLIDGLGKDATRQGESDRARVLAVEYVGPVVNWPDKKD